MEYPLEKAKRALLVSVFKGPQDPFVTNEHLEELEFLCKTYGIESAKKVPCQIRQYDASTFVTKGKLEELLGFAKEIDSDLVIFDDEIAPSQQRNLEKQFGIKVSDRTEVILGVFSQRAHSKEAALQVEIAKLRYEMPRLKRLWTHLERQSGGGYLRGMGEKQIEVDKRLISKRMNVLEKDLEEVKKSRETQRVARERSGIPSFAIVGYTNAGKSTLLNALTDAGIFVEDKLFATLDTTTRKFELNNKQEILLIDTVGFIRKIPHLVVAAFKGTLEEALQADILIHLIDAHHPMALSQSETTIEVLKNLGAKEKPMLTVLNKTDLCENGDMLAKLKIRYPRTVEISALKKRGFEELEDIMLEELLKQRSLIKVRIPQKDYAVVSEIIRSGNVLHQDYEGNDILLEVSLPQALAQKLQRYAI